MRCPRCESERIQRDYDDAVIVLRLVGLHKLLCNTCGLVFKGFDPLGSQKREASADEKPRHNRRRGPRYYAHLPAAISLINDRGQAGKVSYSEPSRGHCETISKFGMRLALVGTRFSESELSRPGQLFFVSVDLPEGPIEAVVVLVTHDRTGDERKKKWELGVKIHQISDEDKERLQQYLDARRRDVPVLISD
jgi:transcription initiation factor TFIIIB Brf1 subunit/transcription initiation factor TFIIB